MMPAMTLPPTDDEQAQRRKRAVRTALVLGIVAVAVYEAFILSGVLAS